jgi:hypothetical protein
MRLSVVEKRCLPAPQLARVFHFKGQFCGLQAVWADKYTHQRPIISLTENKALTPKINEKTRVF